MAAGSRRIRTLPRRPAPKPASRYLARHDWLTDLPNRLQFRDVLNDALIGVNCSNNKIALISIDLDQFKAVNDTLGHPAGDELLKAVSGRLRNCVRKTDIVARLGGDEFAIIRSVAADGGRLCRSCIAHHRQPQRAVPHRRRHGHDRHLVSASPSRLTMGRISIRC